MVLTQEQWEVVRELIPAPARRAEKVVKKGAPIHRVREMAVREEIVRAKEKIPNDELGQFHELGRRIDEQMDALYEDFRRIS